MFGAIAGGIASALAGGAMSKLFGGGQKAASGGIQGDVLATDNNTVGMGDAGIKSAIQGSNEIGRAVQQECRDRTRMPSAAGKKLTGQRSDLRDSSEQDRQRQTKRGAASRHHRPGKLPHGDA